jgi:phosphatidylserine decarboxylase
MTLRRIVAYAIHSAALCMALIASARPVAATNVVVIVNDQDVTVFDSNTRARTARMVIAKIG